jgi:dCMP deaminase
MEKGHCRFLQLAEFIAGWSRDSSTHCGAVIVRPNRTIASVRYNGFPRGCDDEIRADRRIGELLNKKKGGSLG